MKMNKYLFFIALTAGVLSLYSCAVKPHPNERIIVGKWRPVQVEKIVDSSEIQAAAMLKGENDQRKSKTGVPGDAGAGSRKQEAFDRLAQAEARATMEIFPDGTALKSLPGHPVKASWKMKGKGTRIVARNLENKMKFVIEILEINKERIVVIEHAPVGDLKITYEREMQ